MQCQATRQTRLITLSIAYLLRQRTNRLVLIGLLVLNRRHVDQQIRHPNRLTVPVQQLNRPSPYQKRHKQ